MAKTTSAQVAMQWGAVPLALCIVGLGTLDCVGLERIGEGASHETMGGAVDQASSYWEDDPPPVPAERPASVATCLAFYTSQAFEQALGSCELAQREDGGVDVVEALEATRIMLAPAPASGVPTSRD